MKKRISTLIGLLNISVFFQRLIIMKIRSIFYYFSILLLFITPCTLHAQAEVTVTGSWSLNIGLSDFQGDAGSPLNDTYESLIDQIIIDIKGKKVKDWVLYVRRQDNTWSSDFRLNIRRTDDGVGSGAIIGGTTYQEITTIDTEFFQGGKNRRDVDTQLQLKLLSGVVDKGNYQTIVIYTITEL